jgi:hypothetical protein
VQRTEIFVAKIGNIKVEGAAHRNIKFNVAGRCTLKTWISHHCYKYFGALHLLQENRNKNYCRLANLENLKFSAIMLTSYFFHQIFDWQ